MSGKTVFALVLMLSTAAAGAASAQEPNFGRAIAMSPTELVIGQPVNWYGPGMVYTYRLDANGAWRERARLVASDSARMDDFGRALALDGNTLVIFASDNGPLLYTVRLPATASDPSHRSAAAGSASDSTPRQRRIPCGRLK